MSEAFLNHVATAVPPHDIHEQFSAFAPTLLKEERRSTVFRRMADRSQIDHRYSFLKADWKGDFLDASHFYQRGQFPDTGSRMQRYQEHAFTLGKQALDDLAQKAHVKDVTHVIVTSCTGFYAPGLDFEVVSHYGLKASTERTFIGFMGCYAAFNAMKLARHIVRSEPKSKVLILNLELCTLHLQETESIEELLSFLIFADGCAASIISAEPTGLRLEGFNSRIIPLSEQQITWGIGNDGFDMVLSGKVPGTIAASLPDLQKDILSGKDLRSINYWGIHPGGRSVLDSVQRSLDLPDEALRFSRKVLRDFGNMSSATVMFVLKDIISDASGGGAGCAMAFGPGVTVESMTFEKVAS